MKNHNIILLTLKKVIIMLKNGAENSIICGEREFIDTLPYGITPIHRGWEKCPRLSFLITQKLPAGSILTVFSPRSTLPNIIGKSAFKRLLNERVMLQLKIPSILSVARVA
jgi:hypothetical protein